MSGPFQVHRLPFLKTGAAGISGTLSATSPADTAAISAGNTTWNPSDKTAGCTLSGGNLIATLPATNNGVRSIDRVSNGKYYWEVTFTTMGGGVTGVCLAGTALANINSQTYLGTSCFVIGSTGAIWLNGVSSGTVGGTLANGWVCGIALDATNDLIWFRNGAAGNWNNNAANNPTTGVGGISIKNIFGANMGTYACANGGSSSSTITANFGASAFTGTVPSGFISGFPSGTAQNLAAVATTVGIEEWGVPLPTAWFTQIGTEVWSGVSSYGPVGATDLTDTASISGGIYATGTLAATDRTDTCNISITSPALASLAATEAPDTAAIAGLTTMVLFSSVLENASLSLAYDSVSLIASSMYAVNGGGTGRAMNVTINLRNATAYNFSVPAGQSQTVSLSPAVTGTSVGTPFGTTGIDWGTSNASCRFG